MGTDGETSRESKKGTNGKRGRKKGEYRVKRKTEKENDNLSWKGHVVREAVKQSKKERRGRD